MEVYALLGLAGMGIWLNSQRKPVHLLQGRELVKSVGVPVPQDNAAPNRSHNRVVAGERPSAADLYHSTYSQYAAGVEAARAAAAFSAATTDPVRSGRVPSTRGGRVDFEAVARGRADTDASTMKTLAGVDIPIEQFTHNNMQPFYRKTPTQNMEPFATTTRLETLGGIVNDYRKKREVPQQAFFAPERDLGNVYGMQSKVDTMRDHIALPVSRNNEFPIERQLVGPGIGAGFSSEPQDVYKAQREFAMPKSVDELRVANKPKETFTGRTVDGVRTALGAAEAPAMEKRTPDSFREQSSNDILPTTGATLRDQKRPDTIMLRDTTKPGTHRPHVGPAFQRRDVTLATQQAVPSGGPFRAELSAPNVGPACKTDAGRGLGADYGRSAIKVYTTMRETTEARVRTGTFTGAVKALIAPLQDLVRTTRKETITEAATQHSDGRVLQPQAPAKMTVYDADQVARTTVKQTTLQQLEPGNMRATAYKITVYDPEDVARATMRQTTEQAATAANVAAHRYASIVYDPENAAKTTTKQTTLQATASANVAAHRYANVVHDSDDAAKTTTKQTTLQPTAKANIAAHRYANVVHDSDDAARTTIKETNLHDGSAKANNVSAHRYANVVYDPEAIARTTIKETALQEAGNANLQAHEYRAAAALLDAAKRTGRETLDAVDTAANVADGSRAGIVYDPNDIARTTAKETMVDTVREFGNVDGITKGKGGYTIAVADARITNKQTLSDVEYYGQPALEAGDAYRVTNSEAKATQKQVLSDMDYYGGAGSTDAKRPMQQEQYDNAAVRTQQESLLASRQPVEQGVKLSSGVDTVNTSDNTDKRQVLAPVSEFVSLERTPAQMTGGGVADAVGGACVTRERHAYRDLDRLDEELMAQLIQSEKNDLTISVVQRAQEEADADSF